MTRIVALLGRGRSILLLAGMLAMAGCGGTVGQFVLHDQARYALKQGDYEVARERYERLADREPESGQYQYGLGKASLETGRLNDAGNALDRAWALKPGDRNLTPRILDNLAEAYYQKEDYEGLRRFLREQNRQYGNSASFLRQAEYLSRIGDADGARVAYRKAARVADEDNPRPYLAMAAFYRSVNDRQNARRALQYAYHVAPHDRQVQQELEKAGLQPPEPGSAPPRQPDLVGEE